MQTWIVHMRAPFRMMRELGPSGFITLQLVVGGTVLAALVHPVFLAALALDFATAEPRFDENQAEIILYWSTLVGGYATSAVLGLVGFNASSARACLPLSEERKGMSSSLVTSCTGSQFLRLLYAQCPDAVARSPRGYAPHRASALRWN